MLPPKIKAKFDPQALDRDDYPILEKIITFGELMRQYNQEFHTLAALVDDGKLSLDRYKRVLPRGENVEQRDQILKAALVEAYEINPSGLVEACAGGQRGKPGQIVTNLWHDLCDGRDDSLRQDMVRDFALVLGDRYAMDRRNARGLNAVDLKGKTIMEVRADDDPRDRAKSTNMIRAWDPSKYGVVGYIRGCLKKTCAPIVMLHYSESMKNESYERLESLGVEASMSEDGKVKFVRSQVSREFEGTTETVEERFEEHDGIGLQERLRDAEREKQFREVERAAAGEEEPENADAPQVAGVDETEKTIREIAEEENLDRPRKLCNDPKSSSRSDLKLIINTCEELKIDSSELVSAASPEMRHRMMHDLVTKIVAACPNMEERDAVLESLPEWDPAKFTLDTWIPEIRATVENMDKAPVAPTVIHVMESLTKLEEQEEFGFADATSLTPTQSAEARLKAVEAQVALNRAWREHSTPESLKSPTRGDFTILEHCMKTDLTAIPTAPSERRGFLRAEAQKFVSSRLGLDDVSMEIIESVKTWDPEKNFFTEVVCRKIIELAEVGRLSKETIVAEVKAPRSLLSDEDKTESISDQRREAAAIARMTDQSQVKFGDIEEAGRVAARETKAKARITSTPAKPSPAPATAHNPVEAAPSPAGHSSEEMPGMV